MKVKLLPAVIAACSFFSIPFAGAGTYQSEISAEYGETDYDGSSSDIYDVLLTGTYYFSAVDTTNRPLAESAFLQKASNVYVNGYYEEDKETGSGVISSDVLHTYGRAIGADFYIPNSIFFVGAGIAEAKSKNEWRYNGNSYRETHDWDSFWYVKAGITPIDGLLVWSEFYEDVDVSDFWNINAKYVLPLGSGNQWLNLETSYETQDGDDGDLSTFYAAADYYIDSNLSVGGGITHYTYDDDGYDSNNNASFIRDKQYFTDNLSANIKYADGDFESRWEIGASIRF